MNASSLIARGLIVRSALAVAVAALSAQSRAADEESPLDGIDFVYEGSTGKIGGIAEIAVPEGYAYTDGRGARRILELCHNPTDGYELGLIAPTNFSWFALFTFADVGYVKDDEKDSLDADAILESLREGTEAANEERRARGWSELRILGWEREPHYDEATHNLEWATRAESDDGITINYNTRILGRRGVMSVTLVSEPQYLASALVGFKSLLKGYAFTSGNRYAEYRKGDRIAEYGLAALITGGAAAVAVKSGLFKWIWKIVVVAAVAVGGFFKKLFGRKDG